jgi:hypothetical protein
MKPADSFDAAWVLLAPMLARARRIDVMAAALKSLGGGAAAAPELADLAAKRIRQAAA